MQHKLPMRIDRQALASRRVLYCHCCHQYYIVVLVTHVGKQLTSTCHAKASPSPSSQTGHVSRSSYTGPCEQARFLV